MLEDKHIIHSSHLNKIVDVKIYGHYGIALLIFPAFTDSCSEAEENGLIEAVTPFLKKGKCRIFSISTVNQESWLNDSLSNEEKSQKHHDFNNFVVEELIHEIYSHCGGPIPILTVGADIGAFHAANTYFRRPDIFLGCIAMSGFYSIENLAKDYFDSNCYFNSPVHYLPNLNDNYWLSFLMSKKHTYLLSGSGDGEQPGNTNHFSEILKSKNIPHVIDIWNQDWGHNWKSWSAMLAKVLETKL